MPIVFFCLFAFTQLKTFSNECRTPKLSSQKTNKNNIYKKKKSTIKYKHKIQSEHKQV